MIKYLIVFVLGLLGLFCYLSGGVKVEIIVNTPPVPQGDTVYIAGNQEYLGGWHPAKVPLEKIADNKWRLILNIDEAKANLEFKFTRGGWEAEAVTADGEVPPNYNLVVTHDTTMNITIDDWRDKVENLVVFKGGVTGKLEYLRDLQYDILLPRDVVIWLPPGYEDSEESYPVLYMHDGQNIVDPKTTPFGVDWQMDEAADSLIRQGVIEPFILVGVYNSRTRMSDYRNIDTGFVYVEFLAEYLKPKIDSLYRTKPSTENTYNGGSSMGGIVSLMTAWERSDVFGGALCFSPAFKISVIDYVKPVESYTGEKKNLKLFIINGGVGIDAELQPGIDEMILALEKQGFSRGNDLYYEIFPEDTHSERDWAKRIPIALKYLFGKE
ncbi:MAG: phosphonate ABC transporter ATP-binding protein [Melioribacteraceae bacterium]|nr:MAG: phosphonate ABC transporter ATP-binding protein [Melioribacteraceae bacterium]